MNEVEYLFVCAMEECGEITQIISKIERFGWDDSAPNTQTTNKELFVKEINDLLGVLEMLKERGVPLDGIGNGEDIENKKAKVEKFMEYSRRVGRLT